MKVFISADLEGVSGVVSMDDVFPGREGYPDACQMMTGDVNAAVEGALAAGADDVVVFDAHAGGRNLDLEALHPGAQVIRGQPVPVMVGGLDDGFDALLLIGYHAMRGTADAVMDHTYTSAFNRVWINGSEVGEVALAAAFAGHYGVPVAMISGDEKVCEEGSALVPTTLTALVKWGMGRHAAHCLSLEQARTRIRDTASRAVAGIDHMVPYVLDAPLALEVEYPSTASADRAAWLPTVERKGPRRIACTLGDMPSLVGLLSVLVGLTDKS